MRDNESVDRRIADDFRNWNDFSHALTSENNESCSDQRVLAAATDLHARFISPEKLARSFA